MRFPVLYIEKNMTEYYYGDFNDADRTEICRYKGYGTDSENEYRRWQVLVGRLTFVIVFEVGIRVVLHKYTNKFIPIR